MSDVDVSERIEKAHHITTHHERLAFAAGLVPVPLFDILAVTAIQLRLLSRLAKHYEVKFVENRAKSLIAALLGSVIPTALGRSLSSLVKMIPVIGTAIGVLTLPVFAAASTRAVGRVFVQHFETGGTLLDFDPETTREYFRQEFEAGKAEHDTSTAASQQGAQPA